MKISVVGRINHNNKQYDIFACPFCGNAPVLRQGLGHNYRLECENLDCLSCYTSWNEFEIVVKQWNARKIDVVL